MGKCPECSGELEDGAEFCPHCFVRVRMTPSTQALTQQVVNQRGSRRSGVDWEKLGHGVQLLGCSLTLLIWVIIPMLVVLGLILYAVSCQH